ncbi:Rpn family recombination-promoting nuclease/putative transposase [Fibrella aquatilis]|uniref:Rpn family recombination-promoting nuclease/putative transposase n=1 Tax=Fibrella aquatilis TaxID=2817059 RepID=A0A939GCW4_9BACT|nr:Rpn family recombination-promoting nuclease/putative transposase [Fibrella aquatilis]MBO0934356.1 Rpn family recombination-promoting nuclease/putative transposase [Fibrella aquatilis]
MAQNHTHDHFFKIAFSRTNVVADFIQAFLPPDFSQQLDLETLARLGDSFVDEQLAQHYADLLYSVNFGDTPITIALLFEHKSYTEEYPHFQLARYMLNLWQEQLTNKEPLTRVVPILLYHGLGRWKQQSMTDYFGPANSVLNSFVPDFQYLLINLRKAPDSQFSLLTDDYAKITAGLLRTIRERRQLTRMFEELAATFDSLVGSSEGEQFVKTAFLYVHWSSKLTSAEMVAIFNRISPKSAQVVISAAELLLQEGLENGLKKGFQIGVEEGMKQGVEQGLKQGVEQGLKQGVEQGDHKATVQHVKGLLEMGLDTELIARAFGLTTRQLHAIICEIKGE